MSKESNTKTRASFAELNAKLFDILIPEIPMDQPGFMFNYLVNISKGGMFVLTFTLMIWFNNFSLPALLITLFHGSYGLIWLFKDIVFPDKSFAFKTNGIGAAITGVALICYATMAFFIITNTEYRYISVDRFFCAGYLYIFGVILMITSDAQKTFTLKIKKGLISDGLNAITRNPNYVGEISLYLGFGILAQHTFCYCYLVIVWVCLFWSRMDTKDKSLSKKDGWKKYSEKSYMLLPRVFSSHMMNHLLYFAVAGLVGYLYCSGGLLNRLIESRGGQYMVGW
jgi:protein-S-isoprenylcysteine O-methyltransferase Ste14